MSFKVMQIMQRKVHYCVRHERSCEQARGEPVCWARGGGGLRRARAQQGRARREACRLQDLLERFSLAGCREKGEPGSFSTTLPEMDHLGEGVSHEACCQAERNQEEELLSNHLLPICNTREK